MPHTALLRWRRYGDIGRACAGLARAFRMRVLGLRRRVQLSAEEAAAGLVVRHHVMAHGMAWVSGLKGGSGFGDACAAGQGFTGCWLRCH